MKFEKLYNSKFIEIRKIIAPDSKAIHGYEYVHDISCNSQKIALLPFRKYENKIQFLLRHEIVPPWDPNQPQSVSLTGSVEKDPLASAVKELHEESGYRVPQSELIELGMCYANKALDVKYFLYSVELTGKTRGMAVGDGSYIEKIGQCIWRPRINTNDAILSMLYLRLVRYLRKQMKKR